MNIANNEEPVVKSENIVNNERYIEVPRGWNRCLENGNIVYFSPTQICLRSKEDIARYLISDRTCKCGLDCPLYIDKVFDFDASLPSRHFRLLKLENDHKTLCKETIKARFATLAQSQTVIKPEVNVGKPVVIKRKSEVSVPKKKNEASKSPSFDTLVSLADAKPNQTLQEEELKPKKPRKPVLHQKKSNLTVTSVIPMPVTTAAMVPNYQTVHSNMSPVLHSSFMIPKSPSVDAVPMAQQQQPTVSTGAVFGGSDHQVHSQNVGSLLAFPSTQLNASSFLAALSSAPSTISGRTTSTRAGEVSYVHPLHPFSTKSTAEQAQFGQKIAAFPGVPSQSNNVVYLSSSGLHTIANQNSNVNWPQAPGIPLSRLPQASPDKTSLEKPKGGFTMKVQENAPKLVFPYPNQAQNPATMTSSSASHVTSKAQMKHDLPQVLQKQQLPVNTTVPGRSEPALPTKVHPIAISSNSDKPNNIRPPTNPVDPLNQPLQYCGIILQPGVVPGVQLAGATPRPSAGACKSQEQNPYSNLYTLQGLPYGNNVANPTVLGVTPNTVIPYFLGITQPGTPKPIVPATTATTTTKESSPTTYAAPVSTSAIAAAYSAFVSIAPASVTTSSFSQQLVNLVSNYNNPYWQQLLTQGASSNTLAYQLMQISQYASTRPGLPSQNTKTFNGKNTTPSYGQTKMTASTSKSSGSSSQESKPKIVAKNTPIPVPVTTNAVTTSGVVAVGSTSSVVITNTIVSTVDEGERRKVSDSTSMSMISKSCTSSTVTSCSATVASTKDNNMKQEHTSTTTTTEISTPMNSSSMEKDDFNSVESSSTHETSAEKTARTDTETGSNESLTENSVFTNSEKDICTKDKSAEEIECASSETNAAANDNSLQNNEKDDLKNDTSEEKEGSSASEIVVSTPDDSVEKMDCVSNEAVKLTNNDSAEKCEIVDSDMAASIHDDSAPTKECTSNETIEDSNTEEKSDRIASEVDDGISCENKDNPVNPDLIDTITQNSGQEVCGDMKKDIVTPPNELSEVISTDEITNDSLNSETEEVSVTSVTVSKDSITIESEQLIDSSTSESQSIVTAEGKSTSECEVVKSPDAHTESSTVKSDSENVNSECNNTTLDLDNDTSHECSNLTLESSTNEERHVEVSEVDKESDCDVKTETLGNNDIGADLVTDTNVKTGAPEDSVPNEPKMETEDEASSSMSKKRKCDEECKVINKKEIKKQDVQNCKTESVLNDAKITKEVNQEMVASEAPVEFTIGDIVWAQARGLPSWPGKIVHERDVGNGKAAADIGKKWVMWFGDHNFSQVEVEKLKTLTDGLKTLDDKGKKRKYRGKRTRVGLEQAISEALEELDQRERLRSRQGPKAKKRRL